MSNPSGDSDRNNIYPPILSQARNSLEDVLLVFTHVFTQQPCFSTKTKKKRLHNNKVEFPEDLVGAPTCPPFLCLGAPTWPPLRHVKTENKDDTKGRFCVGFSHEAANPRPLNNFHCLIYGGVMNSRTVVGNVIINRETRGVG